MVVQLPKPLPLSERASARIELLRLLLVGQVVFGHLAMVAYPEFASLDLSRSADLFVAGWRLVTRFGGQAAIVFICLSGYFLVPRLLEAALRAPDAPPLGTFIRGRLRRVYPTLLIALALTAACDFAGIYLFGGEALYRATFNYDATAALDWPNALGNLFSLQPTFAGAFGSNGPLWTLGYIVQFYCAGAALAYCERRQRGAGALLLVAILAAATLVRPEWAILFVFWLGCAATRWIAPQKTVPGLAVLALGISLFVLANQLPPHINLVAAGFAGMALVIGCNVPVFPNCVATIPALLKPIASANYQIYAVHMPLAMLLHAVLIPLLDWSSLVVRVIWPIVAICLTLAFALSIERLLRLKRDIA